MSHSWDVPPQIIGVAAFGAGWGSRMYIWCWNTLSTGKLEGRGMVALSHFLAPSARPASNQAGEVLGSLLCGCWQPPCRVLHVDAGPWSLWCPKRFKGPGQLLCAGWHVKWGHTAIGIAAPHISRLVLISQLWWMPWRQRKSKPQCHIILPVGKNRKGTLMVSLFSQGRRQVNVIPDIMIVQRYTHLTFSHPPATGCHLRPFERFFLPRLSRPNSKRCQSPV